MKKRWKIVIPWRLILQLKLTEYQNKLLDVVFNTRSNLWNMLNRIVTSKVCVECIQITSTGFTSFRLHILSLPKEQYVILINSFSNKVMSFYVVTKTVPTIWLAWMAGCCSVASHDNTIEEVLEIPRASRSNRPSSEGDPRSLPTQKPLPTT